MKDMFLNCVAFHSNLDDWDVCKVSKMSNMFVGCKLMTTIKPRWTAEDIPIRPRARAVVTSNDDIAKDRILYAVKNYNL